MVLGGRPNWWSYMSTLRPKQINRHFADANFKGILVNETFCILFQISLTFILKGRTNNFSQWLGDVQETCHCCVFSACLITFWKYIALFMLSISMLHGFVARYVKLRVAHAPGMPGTFSPPPRVSDPDMYHGTCVTHVPRCMPESLTRGFLWNRWRGKRSRHSRRMRNP